VPQIAENKKGLQPLREYLSLYTIRRNALAGANSAKVKIEDLEHFCFCYRLPCPILSAAFRRKMREGWDANEFQVYNISENALIFPASDKRLCSGHQESTIDFDNLALNETRPIAAEKNNSVCNLFRPAEPPGRRSGANSVQPLFGGKGTVVIGVHRAR
jgi:hypothetical protein